MAKTILLQRTMIRLHQAGYYHALRATSNGNRELAGYCALALLNSFAIRQLRAVLAAKNAQKRYSALFPGQTQPGGRRPQQFNSKGSKKIAAGHVISFPGPLGGSPAGSGGRRFRYCGSLGSAGHYRHRPLSRSAATARRIGSASSGQRARASRTDSGSVVQRSMTRTRSGSICDSQVKETAGACTGKTTILSSAAGPGSTCRTYRPAARASARMATRMGCVSDGQASISAASPGSMAAFSGASAPDFAPLGTRFVEFSREFARGSIPIHSRKYLLLNELRLDASGVTHCQRRLAAPVLHFQCAACLRPPFQGSVERRFRLPELTAMVNVCLRQFG